MRGKSNRTHLVNAQEFVVALLTLFVHPLVERPLVRRPSHVAALSATLKGRSPLITWLTATLILFTTVRYDFPPVRIVEC
jgi:hypothetical protein